MKSKRITFALSLPDDLHAKLEFLKEARKFKPINASLLVHWIEKEHSDHLKVCKKCRVAWAHKENNIIDIKDFIDDSCVIVK